MAVSMKNVDLVFQGVGQKAGIDIWRIENFQPVPVPKSEFGKFYAGDSYIILKTTALKNGSYQYDAHFWLGKESSQDETGTAAIKTVELDVALGGRAVQHREVQGHETDKFLSYFKPCIIPLEGGVASGFRKVEAEKFEPRLYICKGRHAVRVKQVPYSRSSLNHDDVFILDTETKIYQFNGSSSNIQERAKALEVVQYIKDTYHDGKCDVAVVDDGKLVAEADTGEFWSLFGGFAPIGKRTVSEDDSIAEASLAKLYLIEEGQLNPIDRPLSKGMLESNKCYLLDCGVEVYVWIGRITSLEERKAASVVSEEFLSSQRKPKHTHITKVIQGFETLPFRTNFDSWPVGGGTGSAEDGRGKVAALLKQQGVNVKGIVKGAPSKKEIPPVFDKQGKLEVWRIDGLAKHPVPSINVGKFFSGDCYLLLYTYLGDRRDEYFLCFWSGKHSCKEDQDMARHLANQMANSFKGRAVQGHILEGKEPAQFIGLFESFIVLKGGVSSCYKKKIKDQECEDDTYSSDGIALFQVEGNGPHDSKCIQVDLDGSCLNSAYCFILQSNGTVFVWNGSASMLEEQLLAAKFVENLKPGSTPKVLKEGSEPATFWNPLGGKQSHSNQRKLKDPSRDSRLFACSLVKDKLEVTEVFNFCQDDLLSEDVMILDAHTEVFVWVGQHADAKEKQQAFDIAQRYVEQAASHEGMLTDVPVFHIAEGNEPFFFTKYFNEWDIVKATVQGDSFNKRLLVLFGSPLQASEGPKRRTSAIEAGDAEFLGKASPSGQGHMNVENNNATQKAAALQALSSSLNTSSIVDIPKPFIKPIRVRLPTPDILDNPLSKEEGKEPGLIIAEEEESMDIKGDDENMTAHIELQSDAECRNGHIEMGFFGYDRLKAHSSDPAPGIDPLKRESYLSPEEFKKVFGMDTRQFYELPKWRQDMQKRALDLF